jgi:hypothetical protein
VIDPLPTKVRQFRGSRHSGVSTVGCEGLGSGAL